MITSSTTINNFDAEQTCSITVKFTKYSEYNNGIDFLLNCETADGLVVLCYGKTNLKIAEFKNLNQDNVIKLKNVITGERRPRKNAVDYDFKIDADTMVHLLLKTGKVYQIFPMISHVKRSASTPPKRDEKQKIDSNLGIFSKSTEVLNQEKLLKELGVVDLSIGPSHAITFEKFKKIKMNDDCDVILIIKSYVNNNNPNWIFINCSTCDGMPIVVAAPLDFHTENMRQNDVVQFTNVKRNQPKKNEYGLRFHSYSHAYLLYRDGRSCDPPKEFLNNNFKKIERKVELENSTDSSDENEKNGYSDYPSRKSSTVENTPELERLNSKYSNDGDSSNNLMTGTLTTNFEKVHHYKIKKPIYKADLKLDNGTDDVKLLIDAEFGKWPLHLLKKGHRVTVGGADDTYYQQPARFICKGDDFDVESLTMKQTPPWHF